MKTLNELVGVAAAVVTRVTIGVVFAVSGWGKLTNLSRTIEYFASIHIPYPRVQAPFAAGMELLCGILVLIGLGTRWASVPLIVIMIVAIGTAKWGDVDGFVSFFGLSEFLYIVILLWLIAMGAGRFSVDRIFCRRACGVNEKDCETDRAE